MEAGTLGDPEVTDTAEAGHGLDGEDLEAVEDKQRKEEADGEPDDDPDGEPDDDPDKDSDDDPENNPDDDPEDDPDKAPGTRPGRKKAEASTPVIGMDGKTADGAMPYELMMKQLYLLR